MVLGCSPNLVAPALCKNRLVNTVLGAIVLKHSLFISVLFEQFRTLNGNVPLSAAVCTHRLRSLINEMALILVSETYETG